MAFVMPAVALMRDKGALPTFEVGLLFLGVALDAWAASRQPSWRTAQGRVICGTAY